MQKQTNKRTARSAMLLAATRSICLLACVVLACASISGCGAGGQNKVEIADPNSTPAPQPGGVPAGYVEREVVVE